MDCSSCLFYMTVFAVLMVLFFCLSNFLVWLVFKYRGERDVAKRNGER